LEKTNTHSIIKSAAVSLTKINKSYY